MFFLFISGTSPEAFCSIIILPDPDLNTPKLKDLKTQTMNCTKVNIQFMVLFFGSLSLLDFEIIFFCCKML